MLAEKEKAKNGEMSLFLPFFNSYDPYGSPLVSRNKRIQ